MGIQVSEISIMQRISLNIQSIGRNGSWHEFALWLDQKVKAYFDNHPNSSLPAMPLAEHTFHMDLARRNRSIVAARPIAAEEVYLFVPCEAVLFPEKILHGPFQTKLASIAKTHTDITLLGLHITWEIVHLESSSWKEYILTFPAAGAGLRPHMDLYRAYQAALAVGHEKTE